MKILFVGGNFDDIGGNPSSLVEKFATEIAQHPDTTLTLSKENDSRCFVKEEVI